MPVRSKNVKGVDDDGGSVMVGVKQLFPSMQDRSRRQRHIKHFDDLLEASVGAKSDSSGPGDVELREVPTLQVGYFARAMGLNLSNEGVLRLVEMVEDKNARSSGHVPAGLLREVIVEALMTGVLSAPHVVRPPPSRKNPTPLPSVPSPIFVSRDSEETIYQAFRALDLAKHGYLEADELRHFLRGGNEPFTDEEVEEIIIAAADPVSGRIYYEEFADVLATE